MRIPPQAVQFAQNAPRRQTPIRSMAFHRVNVVSQSVERSHGKGTTDTRQASGRALQRRKAMLPRLPRLRRLRLVCGHRRRPDRRPSADVRQLERQRHWSKLIRRSAPKVMSTLQIEGTNRPQTQCNAENRAKSRAWRAETGNSRHRPTPLDPAFRRSPRPRRRSAPASRFDHWVAADVADPYLGAPPWCT